MEAKESIEIPFGAFDSELKGWEYTIPEGMEAEIKDGKIIVREKEGEDGRIRKMPIGQMECWHECALENNVVQDIKDSADAIAWLEKQGSQNPKLADFIPADCTSDAKNENRWHKIEDSLPDNSREVLCKDAIGNFFIGRYYNNGDYWEVSMYDEPDKSNEDNPSVIMWTNIPSCEQNLDNPAKTYKDEQKPAWSEEDFSILNRICAILVDASEVKNWWKQYRLIEKDEMLKLTDFLKSLKERYTWKPSESDILLLERIVNGKSNPQDFQASLCGLIGQLKELKG